MKSAYLIAAMPAGTLLPLVVKNRVSPEPLYIRRLAFLLQSSLWSSLLNVREKSFLKKSGYPFPPCNDPVTIVGHWRTGSTYLHQLLNCDPALHAPTLFQTAYPGSFMSSRKFVEPIMKRMLLPFRPMDNVRLGMDEPMEDEGAIFRMTGLSPLCRLIFPEDNGYFLAGDATFLPAQQRDRIRWEKAMLEFAAKIRFFSGRTPLFKCPFHSLRIPVLARLFPKARFVHIYRDPRVVVPSAQRMWAITGKQNALNSRWRPPGLEDVAEVFDSVRAQTRRNLAGLPRGSWCEIKFEDLEREPLETVKKAWCCLGMEVSKEFEQGILDLTAALSYYRKNAYELTGAHKEFLNERLARHIHDGGYV